MSKVLKLISTTALIFAIILLFSDSNSVHAATDTENFIVKVKLTNNLGPSKTYQFIPMGESVLKEDSKIVLKKDVTYKLAIQNSKVSLFEGTKLLKKDLTTVTIEPKIYAKENYILLENMKSTVKRPHIGTIIFRLVTASSTQQIQPVNHLGFEDYLKGVLPGEMPASWGTTGGQEALRAQAIAARSYIFAKMKDESKGDIVDTQLEIDDTTKFQVYNGFIWDKISPSYDPLYVYTTSAVDKTKGMIMTYQKSVSTKGFVTAFFSSSNGGQTELPEQYWSSKLAYLNKTKPDTYDTAKWKEDEQLHFKKAQLTGSTELDLTNPASWWNTTTENNLLSSVVAGANSRTAFSKLKTEALKELKLIDPTMDSIKIDSINSINTVDFSNTGKVQDITFKLSYYASKKNPDNSLYYAMKLGAQSQTLAGVSRYETAVEVAKKGWSGKRNFAVLGRGDLPVDALAGSVLANKLDTPILLTRPNSLPASVEEYLKGSLNPNATVYLLGGTLAISPNVENRLEGLGFKVNRVSGKSRTDTSIEIAKIVGGSSQSVFFATGNEKSSDALSISPYAARNQIPIIIQHGLNVSKTTKDYLKNSKKTTVNLIGGSDVVSKEVETTLKNSGYAIDRIFGTSRVDTSIAINKKFVMPGNSLVIGNAYGFIDALAGSVLAAKNNSSILLLHPDAEKIPVSYLENVVQPETLYYLGGETVVSKDLKYSLSKYIGGTLQKFTTEFDFTGSELRSLFGGTVLKSSDFNVEDRVANGEFALNGTGYGHGIGLSQYGAYGRSKAGIKAEEILAFYYQGITIEQAKDYIK